MNTDPTTLTRRPLRAVSAAVLDPVDHDAQDRDEREARIQAIHRRVWSEMRSRGIVTVENGREVIR